MQGEQPVTSVPKISSVSVSSDVLIMAGMQICMKLNRIFYKIVNLSEHILVLLSVLHTYSITVLFL